MQQINEIDRFDVIRSTIDNRCIMHTLDSSDAFKTCNMYIKKKL